MRVGNGIRVGKAIYTDGWGTRHPKKAPDAKEKKKQYMREYMPGYRATHKSDLRRNYRKCMPPLSELIPGYVPLTAAKPIEPPPCGGDCENCPYESCQYPTWDEDHAPKPRKREKERAAHKAKMAEGGAWAEDQRAKQRDYVAKYRAKVRFVKSGGTPEQFAAMWAEAGGDVEKFKRIRDMRKMKEGT